VNTEISSAFVTVNCKVCGNSGSTIIACSSECCIPGVNPISQSRTRHMSHSHPNTREKVILVLCLAGYIYVIHFSSLNLKCNLFNVTEKQAYLLGAIQ
jgi:hypothetical protein